LLTEGSDSIAVEHCVGRASGNSFPNSTTHLILVVHHYDKH